MEIFSSVRSLAVLEALVILLFVLSVNYCGRSAVYKEKESRKNKAYHKVGYRHYFLKEHIFKENGKKIYSYFDDEGQKHYEKSFFLR